MGKPAPTFRALQGIVQDTDSSSRTTVQGGGAGSIYNGTGSIETYVSSTTTHTRDVWILLPDGDQIHRRYFADVPIRRGQRLVEISLTEAGNSIPFALFFPETKTSWLISRKGFNRRPSSLDRTAFKTFIAFWVIVGALGAIDHFVGVPKDKVPTLVWSGTIAYFLYDLVRSSLRASNSSEQLETAYNQFLQTLPR